MARRMSARVLLGTVAVLATVTALTACTIKPSGGTNDLGDTVLKVAADDGAPTFEQNFNPYSASKRIGTGFVYEPLEVVNSLDGTETPFLATGYEQPDASTIVFTIRDGVTWNDGEDFTADDVKFTFDMLAEHPTADLFGATSRIDSVAVDGSTVTFALKSADVTAVRPIEQTLIVPEHIWKDADDPATFTVEKPVGTGPFELGDFAPNQYSMVKYDGYWQADKVAASELQFPASNSQTDIVANGYDWGYAYLSDVENTWVSADPEHNTYWFPAGGVITLFPNLTRAPLDDVNVRQGLSLALDRNAIADDAVEGYVSGSTQTGLLPNFTDWVDSSIPDGGEVKQDADAALAAFEKAGYTQKDGELVDSSGTQLSIEITTANGYTDWLRAVQRVQSQLGDLGIDVKIAQPEPSAYQQALATGDFDLAMGAFGGTGSVFDDYNALLNGSFVVDEGEQAAGNYEKFDDPKISAMLDEFKTTTDEPRQHEIVDELQNVMYDEVPVIAMYYGGLWGIYSDAKLTGWPSDADPYAPPKTWDSSVLLVMTHVKPA